MVIDKEFEELKDSLLDFLQEKFQISERPEVILKNDEENGRKILGFTGYYDPDSEIITIFVADRHPKDILRSIAHEFIHHVQKKEGWNENPEASNAHDGNYIMYNRYLRKMEADAFERGNIAFREWEATEKGYKDKKGSEPMNEGHIPKSKKAAFKRAFHNAGEKLDRSDFSSEDEYWGTKTMIAKRKVGIKEEEVEEGFSGGDRPYVENEGMTMMSKTAEAEGTVINREPLDEKHPLNEARNYLPEERPCADAYNMRDEKLFNDLLRKFKIKK